MTPYNLPSIDVSQIAAAAAAEVLMLWPTRARLRDTCARATWSSPWAILCKLRGKRRTFCKARSVGDGDLRRRASASTRKWHDWRGACDLHRILRAIRRRRPAANGYFIVSHSSRRILFGTPFQTYISLSPFSAAEQRLSSTQSRKLEKMRRFSFTFI